jgi:hypothetical protein
MEVPTIIVITFFFGICLFIIWVGTISMLQLEKEKKDLIKEKKDLFQKIDILEEYIRSQAKADSKIYNKLDNFLKERHLGGKSGQPKGP